VVLQPRGDKNNNIIVLGEKEKEGVWALSPPHGNSGVQPVKSTAFYIAYKLLKGIHYLWHTFNREDGGRSLVVTIIIDNIITDPVATRVEPSNYYIGSRNLTKKSGKSRFRGFRLNFCSVLGVFPMNESNAPPYQLRARNTSKKKKQDKRAGSWLFIFFFFFVAGPVLLLFCPRPPGPAPWSSHPEMPRTICRMWAAVRVCQL